MILKIGTTLERGKYRIDGVLGQGGFGITYLGEQIYLGRKVAIKEFFMDGLCVRDGNTQTVTAPADSSRGVVERFRRKFIKEAQNIARLKHRGIVPIIDIFEENGTAYYIMEHLSGGSLAGKVKQGVLSERDSVYYISQVAAALDYVHSQRVMHLDVKPANILINEENNAVLIDFGLAKQYDVAGQQTSTTPVGISHGYAPLEQYKQGGVELFTPATDVYSLGATLYTLVTGVIPPDASDVMNNGLPPFPSTISPAVQRAITVAMQPAVKARPQSIREFMALLGAEKEFECKPGADVSVRSSHEVEAISQVERGVVPVQTDKDSAREKSHETNPVNNNAGIEEVISRLNENNNKEVGFSSKFSFILILLLIGIFTFFSLDKCNGSEDNYIEVVNIHSSHEFVDLGLPSGVMWATCNVGANSPEEYGGYYSWGEVETKTIYSKSNSHTYGTHLGATIGDISGNSKFDVARAKWGGNWRLPTNLEWKELVDNCNCVWGTYKGIYGCKATSKINGNTIFLPAAGTYVDTVLHEVDTICNYLSSTPEGEYRLLGFGFSESDGYTSTWARRYYGFVARPVFDKWAPVPVTAK